MFKYSVHSVTIFTWVSHAFVAFIIDFVSRLFRVAVVGGPINFATRPVRKLGMENSIHLKSVQCGLRRGNQFAAVHSYATVSNIAGGQRVILLWQPSQNSANTHARQHQRYRQFPMQTVPLLIDMNFPWNFQIRTCAECFACASVCL